MVEKQRIKSLSYRNSDLANTFFQLKVLNGQEQAEVNIPSFTSRLKELGAFPLKPVGIEVFQLNIGKLCNQVCRHCHVDAGPDKTRENMSRENLEVCLHIIKTTPGITTVDITGGAPELHPEFKWFVQECRKLGKSNEPV